MTFYITGMECGTCMALLTQSIQEVKSVKDVSFDIIWGYANVTFNPSEASPHQIAQAVAETMPVHGKPFVATLRFRVPDYDKPGNRTKVDGIFDKHKAWAEIETIDKAKGEFAAHFSSLTVDAGKEGPQGWNPASLAHDIQDAAPKGLGLSFKWKKATP